MTQGMKLVCVSIVVFLIAATSLVLLNFSLSQHHDLLGFSSNRVFLFSMFNTIIFVIVTKSFKPSTGEFAVPFLHFVYEEEEDQSKDGPNDDDDSSNHRSNCYYDDDDDGYYYGSDGYDKDDDDDGSDDEIDWDGDEEHHDDLESRIDEFIAKVITGWREELLREKLYNNHMD